VLISDTIPPYRRKETFFSLNTYSVHKRLCWNVIRN